MADQGADRAREFIEVRSYYIMKKLEREKLEKEKYEHALKVLKEACKYYEKNYPKSHYGITYKDPKGKTPEITIAFDFDRDQGILLRQVLTYFKNETRLGYDKKKYVGSAFFQVNKCIPDLGRIKKLERKEQEKRSLEKEIHELRLLKEKIKKPPEEKKSFVCNWCKKEFEGESAKFEILDHIEKCPNRPSERDKPKKEEEPPKLFTCQKCGIELPKDEMLDHAFKCKGKEEVLEYLCPICNKDCKNGAGLASHKKTHE